MTSEKCVYFGKCGGCVWQDLTQDAYIQKKENFIRRAFQDAGICDIPLKPMILIPTGTRRRASFSMIRGHIGFNQSKSHQIVEIANCPLLTSKINGILSNLRQTLSVLNLTGDVFVLDTDFGIDIHIKSQNKQLSLTQLETLTDLNKISDIVRVAYNNQPIFEKTVLPAFADAFMQPSKEGEQALIQLLLNNIGNVKNAVDLFCGRGTFTHPLLEHGIKVIGYDSASESVAVLGSNGEVRDLFRSPITATELENVDLVVLDPPRAGALAQSQELAQTSVPKIIMISCSPKTAARDCKILCDSGFHIQSITPVDQFKYSNHIETVIVLSKV